MGKFNSSSLNIKSSANWDFSIARLVYSGAPLTSGSHKSHRSESSRVSGLDHHHFSQAIPPFHHVRIRKKQFQQLQFGIPPKSIKIIHFIRIFHSKIQPKTKSPPAPGFFRAWRRLGIDHAPQELPRGRAQHVVRAEQGMGCQEMMTLEQRLGETTRGHTLEGI